MHEGDDGVVDHKDAEHLTRKNISNVYRRGATAHQDLKPESHKIHMLIKEIFVGLLCRIHLGERRFLFSLKRICYIVSQP